MTRYNGHVLAYLGDAVLSLQVRQYLIEQGLTRSKRLQEATVSFVSARNQAAFIRYLLAEDRLSEQEAAIFRLGRNDHHQSVAKNADVITYRTATGMEALWGYLHLEDPARLAQLWEEYKTWRG